MDLALLLVFTQKAYRHLNLGVPYNLCRYKGAYRLTFYFENKSFEEERSFFDQMQLILPKEIKKIELIEK